MTVFDDVSWPDAQRWFRANILLSDAGDVVGADGTSASLTTGRDRELLRALRADAELVVTGAASVRAEGWYFPPSGSMLVVSASGDVPLDSCPRPNDLVIVESLDALDDQLRTSPAQRVLCESGPTLLRELAAQRLIDELFVSVVTASSINTQKREHIARDRLELTSDYTLTEWVVDSDVTFLRFISARTTAHA